MARQKIRPGVLPRAEQIELARRAAAGDRSAAGRLVAASRGFVLKRARKLGAPFLSEDSALLDDLVAEGELGLFEGLQRYDVTRSLHPLTYCAHWIDLRIRNALSKSSGPASVGSPQHWRETGRPRTYATALDAPHPDDPAGPSITDTLVDTAPTPFDILLDASEAKNRRATLAAALDTLPVRERRLLSLRYLSERPLPLVEVGAKLGLSRERTRQLELDALRTLAEVLGATDVEETVKRIRKSRVTQ